MTRREFLQQAIDNCLDMLDGDKDNADLIPAELHLAILWDNNESDSFRLIVIQKPEQLN